MTVVFLTFFVLPEFCDKNWTWARQTEPVFTARGTVQVARYEAAKARMVIAEIERRTSPGDRILLIPYGAMYYFLTGRQPASAHLEYTYGHIIDGPAEAQELTRWTEAHPRLVILDDYPQSVHFPGPVNTFGAAYNLLLGNWIRNHYRETRSLDYSGWKVHFLVPKAPNPAGSLSRALPDRNAKEFCD
jgi:hypothetical protein